MFPLLGPQYEFIKALGSGGTGYVNLAIDTHSGFLVAVKTLFNDHIQNEEILNKFKAEANIYLMLDHPNIVSLKNFILKNHTPHLVQEYVEGRTLDDYISQITCPLPSKIALSIMKDIVDAIDYAHNTKIPIPGYEGVLHLDIKPGNILISKSKHVKIIDYGISQGTNQERSKKIMGSPMYMAPEQLDITRTLDKRTDIYALGVLLHYMVTASKPYLNITNQKELFDNINYKPLARSSDIYPGVDPCIQVIIDKATMKDPDDRYQSCDELLDAIKNL